MNEKMKLAAVNEIIGDFFEFGDEEESTERKLGKAEGTLNAIFSVINLVYKDESAPVINQVYEQIDPETGGLLL